MPHSATEQIIQIASDSAIAKFFWKDRGPAPLGYIKGMALVYARVYCKLKAQNPTALEMAKAHTGNANKDALTWYNGKFQELGLSNNVAGADTLRHLFVLLAGLGMRESSGRFCEGRDRSATNTTSITAEAGLLQTSFNAVSANQLMRTLFTEYTANPDGFVDVFGEGVICKPKDLENFGTGEGRAFQQLSKECPAFAVEFAAVGLRNIRKHWGPLTRNEVQINSQCNEMFLQVQQLADQLNLQGI